MGFPKFVYMTKNTSFFPILHVFAPLNDVRAYSAWSWKTTLITWIFGRAWYPPWHSSGPPRGQNQMNSFSASIIHVFTQGNSPEKLCHNRICCPSNRSKQVQETHTAYIADTQYTRQSLNEKQHTWLHRQCHEWHIAEKVNQSRNQSTMVEVIAMQGGH